MNKSLSKWIHLIIILTEELVSLHWSLGKRWSEPWTCFQPITGQHRDTGKETMTLTQLSMRIMQIVEFYLHKHITTSWIQLSVESGFCINQKQPERKLLIWPLFQKVGVRGETCSKGQRVGTRCRDGCIEDGCFGFSSCSSAEDWSLISSS